MTIKLVSTESYLNLKIFFWIRDLFDTLALVVQRQLLVQTLVKAFSEMKISFSSYDFSFCPNIHFIRSIYILSIFLYVENLAQFFFKAVKRWEFFYLSWSHQQPWSRPPTQPAWWRSWIVYQDYVLEHLCDLYSYILEIYFATKKVCCTVAYACSWEIFPHNGTHPVTAFEHFSSMSFSQFFSVSIVPWVNPLLMWHRNSCVHVEFKLSA